MTITTLSKTETQLVAGGSANRATCIWGAKDRDINVQCYNSDGSPGKGWMADSIDCAEWFCFKNNNYHYLVTKGGYFRSRHEGKNGRLACSSYDSMPPARLPEIVQLAKR